VIASSPEPHWRSTVTPGVETGEPGEIAGAVGGVAEKNVVDLARLYTGIAENTGDQRCRQLRRFDIAKRAVDAADRCAQSSDNDRYACRVSR
jgi:hypothetical protein